MGEKKRSCDEVGYWESQKVQIMNSLNGNCGLGQRNKDK